MGGEVNVQQTHRNTVHKATVNVESRVPLLNGDLANAWTTIKCAKLHLFVCLFVCLFCHPTGSICGAGFEGTRLTRVL